MANDFTIEGAKWGATPGVLPGIPDVGTPGGIVKWAVDATIPASVQTLIGDAFSEWAQYANIQFQEVKTPADAQITFNLGPIDGPSNTLGVTNYSYSSGLLRNATIKMDSTEPWDFTQPVKNDPTNFSILPTLLHEIGHAIGLGHYNSPDAIMSAFRNDAVTALTQSEVDGIQFLYGGPANGIGSAFNDTLKGDAASDKLQGLGGDDHVSGAAGNDVLRGGDGGDHLDGGAGIDSVMYSDSTAGVTVNLAAGTGVGGSAQGDVLTGIENVYGSNYNSVLTGNDVANGLIGGAGNDRLDGGAGNDTLRGAAGSDRLDGGTGIDTADYVTSNIGIKVNLSAGTASGGDAQGDVLVSIENLSGSQGNDILTGNADANVLQGQNGNDTLNGGAGKDTLTGGAGADKFVFTAVGDTVIGANADRITDFSHSQGDKIDLSAIDANTGAAGNQAFTFIGTGLFTHHAGELDYAYNGNGTTIAGDINGDGTSDFHIALTGKIALLAADFVL